MSGTHCSTQLRSTCFQFLIHLYADTIHTGNHHLPQCQPAPWCRPRLRYAAEEMVPASSSNSSRGPTRPIQNWSTKLLCIISISWLALMMVIELFIHGRISSRMTKYLTKERERNASKDYVTELACSQMVLDNCSAHPESREMTIILTMSMEKPCCCISNMSEHCNRKFNGAMGLERFIQLSIRVSHHMKSYLRDHSTLQSMPINHTGWTHQETLSFLVLVVSTADITLGHPWQTSS